MVFTHRDAFPPSHPPMCSGGRDQRDEVFLMGRKRERNNDFFLVFNGMGRKKREMGKTKWVFLVWDGNGKPIK